MPVQSTGQMKRCGPSGILILLTSLLSPSLGSQAREKFLLQNLGGPSPVRHSDVLQSENTTISQAELVIYGLTPEAVVAGRIALHASISSQTATVVFAIDGHDVWTTSSHPFALGRPSQGDPLPSYSLESLAAGRHVLAARATLADGTVQRSAPLPFIAVATINSEFSGSLTPYPTHGSAQEVSADLLVQRTSTPNAALNPKEKTTRLNVFSMYLSWGIDPSIDLEHDQSELLERIRPRTSPSQAPTRFRPLSMRFSPDAPFYHRIPASWPKVLLPSGYISSVQLNEAYQGDGIGFGEVVASASDPLIPVVSQWYTDAETRRTFRFRIPSAWQQQIPTQTAGDQHVIFVDPISNTFISSYKTSLDAKTGGVRGLYISAPRHFGTLGDEGGSNAAGFADLPVMIQPGEVTDPDNPIPHAIGGALHRVWAARVYPATAMDAGVLTSKDTCRHGGYTNTGLIPYGGVIQLDPAIDLNALGLSLPAFQILRAMQEYGYYVMDFGCADFDIYSAIHASELDAFGGPWGNQHGPGVQNELQGVLAGARLYVVAPLVKR